MRDAGYTYIVIDDCWEEKERDAQGNIVADHVKFPHGMKALSDWLHQNGFKFGFAQLRRREDLRGRLSRRLGP